MFRQRVGKFTICLSLKLRLILETFKLLKSLLVKDLQHLE